MVPEDVSRRLLRLLGGGARVILLLSPGSEGYDQSLMRQLRQLVKMHPRGTLLLRGKKASHPDHVQAYLIPYISI